MPKPLEPGDDGRRWLEPGNRGQSEATLSSIGINKFISEHYVTKEIQVCARWERDYLKNSLKSRYENEWQSSFELCNPLTITIYD
jgi:hypothetical protein